MIIPIANQNLRLLRFFWFISFAIFEVFDDLNPHGSLGGFDWRDFKHGNESRPLVFRAVQMTPCVGALGFWMPGQIENLNIAFPYRLVLKNFVDRHGSAPSRAAVVQLRNRDLNIGQYNPVYSPQRSTSSATIHALDSTPAACAGVMRIAPCVFTKL